jgi:hypothetical protein
VHRTAVSQVIQRDPNDRALASDDRSPRADEWNPGPVLPSACRSARPAGLGRTTYVDLRTARHTIRATRASYATIREICLAERHLRCHDCFMRSRYVSLLPALAVALGGTACRPRAAHPVALANPGATFEVRLTGCGSVGVTGRRFGHDAKAAVLWSSERVQTAPALPCAATIDAVRGTERHAAYRVSRTRDGGYTEQLLPRQHE